MAYNYHSAAILMVKGGDLEHKVNPANPDPEYWLYEPGMVGYVVRKESPGRNDGWSGTIELWTSHGHLGDSEWHVGAVQEAHHDQSGRTKGWWKIIGIVEWEQDEVVPHGEVPNKKLEHGVFK